jgi:hypothetical protein
MEFVNLDLGNHFPVRGNAFIPPLYAYGNSEF